MSDFVLTTPSGRAIDVSCQVVEMAETPDDSTVELKYATPKGSTATLRYQIKDGSALQEIADNLPEFIDQTLVLLVKQLVALGNQEGK